MNKIIILVLSLFCFSSLSAKDSLLTIKQQLDRMQREVNDLSQFVFKDSENNPTNDLSDFTAFDLRMYDLEKDIKKLNENYEELIFAIDDLKKLFQDLSLNMNTNSLIDIDKEENSISEVVEQNDLDEDNILGSITISSDPNLEAENKLELNEKKIEKKLPLLTIEDEYNNARNLIRAKQYNEAQSALKVFISNHPENNMAGFSHYWLGNLYLMQKEYVEAALILAEGYQKFPSNIKAPDMLFNLSESLININKIDESCSTLKKFIQEFPNHPLISRVNNHIKKLKCNNSTE